MKYELAKKLKDAGFPQPSFGKMGNWQGPKNWKDRSELCYCPTLSELIEACGEYLCILQCPKEDGWVVWWSKTPFQKTLGMDSLDVFMETQANGSTPEEAVANLWLALNKL